LAFGSGLVTSNGDQHRLGRQLFGKYFIKASVAQSCGAFNKITQDMIAEYLKPKVAASSTGVKFNMEEFFARLALRNFMMFSSNVDTSKDPKFESILCHAVADGSYAVARMVLLQEPHYSIFPNAKVVFRFNAIAEKFFYACIDERKQKLAAGETFDDALTVLMTDQQLSEQDRLDHFKTLISAGHDTTAFFMSYMAYLLARNPVIQQRLHDYLEEKLRDKQVITADDFVELKYLHCVMMETLRLYAIIPVVTRECREDVHVKDAELSVVIPKNITLLIPMIVINKDPEIWENPHEFDPSRFERKPSADFTSAKDGFFPFSYGSRTCIGNVLAQIESAIAFVHLLRNFIIEEDVGFRPNIRAGISLTTSNGINVKLRSR
jgi:cytochrome P450